MVNTIVGSAAFITLSEEADDDWIKIVAGSLGILAAVLVAIQNFQQSGERAEKHRQIATRFSELKRKIELNRALAYPQLEVFLKDFDEKYCQLIKDAPTPNEAIYKKVRTKQLQDKRKLSDEASLSIDPGDSGPKTITPT